MAAHQSVLKRQENTCRMSLPMSRLITPRLTLFSPLIVHSVNDVQVFDIFDRLQLSLLLLMLYQTHDFSFFFFFFLVFVFVFIFLFFFYCQRGYLMRIFAVLAQFCAKVFTQCLYPTQNAPCRRVLLQEREFILRETHKH